MSNYTVNIPISVIMYAYKRLIRNYSYRKQNYRLYTILVQAPAAFLLPVADIQGGPKKMRFFSREVL